MVEPTNKNYQMKIINSIVIFSCFMLLCMNNRLCAQLDFKENQLELFAKNVVIARQIQINLNRLLNSYPWKMDNNLKVVLREYELLVDIDTNLIIIKRYLNINQDSNIVVFQGVYNVPIYEDSYLLAFNRQGGLYCLNGFDTNHFVQYMYDRWKPITDTGTAIEVARQYVLTVQYSPFDTRYVVENDSTIRDAGGYGYAQLPRATFDGLAYSVVLYTYNAYTKEVIRHQVRIKWNGDKEAAYVRYYSSIIREAEH